MEKKRILHVLNWLNYGGAERFLLNLVQYIDKDRFQFDIMVRNSQNPMSLDFEKHGVKIIEAPDFPKNFIQNYQFLKEFAINHGHKYDYLHIHANSLVYTFPITIFKKYAKNTGVILHSHSSLSTNKIVTKVHQFNKKRVLESVDTKVAVSLLSGDWMFTEEDFKVIYNGIDIKKFLFNQNSRDITRRKLKVHEDDILLGIVGRLVPVKNHEYIINLLKKINDTSLNNYKLAIVGDGPLDVGLTKLVEDSGLGEQVIFTGPINDIPSVLSAMDIYLQPSLFEGFPFTVVEAQVSNLPVLISDRISKEVIISEKLIQLSLEEEGKWIDAILEVKNDSKRSEYSGIDIAKVDMKYIAREIETNIYK